jgi:hypothetical protein
MRQVIFKRNLLNACGLVFLVLAGCATESVDYAGTRSSWQGARYETVVAQWGAPASTDVLPDGRELHTWFSQTGDGGGAWYPSVGLFGGSRGVGVGTGVTLGQGGGDYVRCERAFYFRDGRVVEQTWFGSSRYCSTFQRHN